MPAFYSGAVSLLVEEQLLLPSSALLALKKPLLVHSVRALPTKHWNIKWPAVMLLGKVGPSL